MYYKQNINDIKLAIISFDDVMFDFNRLRYNYIKRLSKINNVSFNEEVFISSLGSSNVVYNSTSLIESLYTKEQLEQKVDEDLYTYSKINGVTIKPGINELLELFHQKQIPVVAVSSYSKELADKLLELSNIYRQPDLLIGKDNSSNLASTLEIYQSILDEYYVSGDKVCVIASTYNSVITANKLRCNVIFVPGLAKGNKEMEIRSMKIDNTLLDVINTLLFGKYEELGIYYPLIVANQPNLTENYRLLIEEYKDDQEVLKILETIYNEEFLLMQKQRLQEEIIPINTEVQENEDTTENETVANNQETMIETEEYPTITESLEETVLPMYNEEIENEEDIIEEIIAEPAEEIDLQIDEVDSKDADHLENLYFSMIDTLSLKKQEFINDIEEKENSLNEELVDIISDIDSTASTNQREELHDEDKDKEQEELSNTFFSHEELKFFGAKVGKEDTAKEAIVKDDEILKDDEKETSRFGFLEDLLYAFLCNILLVFFSLITYIALGSWLNSTNSIAFFIMSIVNGYVSICRFIYSLIPFISTQLVTKNIISDLFLSCLSFIVVNTIIISIALLIKSKIKNKK